MGRTGTLALCVVLLFAMLPITMAATCSDTDGGEDIYVRGTATREDLDPSQYQISRTDMCWGEGTLIEMYCDEGQSLSREYGCQYGCRDGACASSAQGCFETDASDQSAQGSTTGIPVCDDQASCTSYVTRRDRCEPEGRDSNDAIQSYVNIELRCMQGAYFAQERVACPHGCFDGYCLKSPPSCADSDGGRAYYSKGKAVYSNNPHTKEQQDYCEPDGAHLIEMVCNSQTNYLLNKEKVLCPNGCSDGRCLGEAPQQQASAPSCADSDGGAVYGVRGTATGALCAQGRCAGASAPHTDSCTGDMLTEFSCAQGYAFSEQRMCEHGCVQGACAQQGNRTMPPPAGTCADSDRGKEYGVRGTVQADGKELHDACLPRSSCRSLVGADHCVNETSCGALGGPEFSIAPCPHGCGNGACLARPASSCNDSDLGDIETRGIVEIAESGLAFEIMADSCVALLRGPVGECEGEGCAVEEYTCAQDGAAQSSRHFCEFGCAQGACLPGPSCAESEGGIDIVLAGAIEGTRMRDTCWDAAQDAAVARCEGEGCLKREYFCASLDASYRDLPCGQGCSEGACGDAASGEQARGDGAQASSVSWQPAQAGEEDAIQALPYEGMEKRDVFERVIAIRTDSEGLAACEGCESHGACLPVGIRLVESSQPRFCASSGTLERQGGTGTACVHNYQCESNSCAQGVCAQIDAGGTGALKRAVSWLAIS